MADDRTVLGPEPELIEYRDPSARAALEALGESTWRAALDWLYGEALRRPMHANTYPEAREAFFGPTGRPAPAPVSPSAWDDVLGEFRTRVAPATYNAQHPGSFSYFTPPPLPSSIAGEVLAQWIHQGVDVWHAGPIGTFVEEEVTAWLRELVGIGDDGWGVLTSGGVMANIMAMTVARDVWLPTIRGTVGTPRGGALDGARVYVSDQAHFSISRALGVLGFPDETLRVLPSDDRFRLEAAPVAEAIEADRAAGLTPLAIAAVAGSTNTGSVDDVPGARRPRRSARASGCTSTRPTAAPRACRPATPIAYPVWSAPTASPSIPTSGSSRPTTSAGWSCAGARISSARSTSRPSTTGRRGRRTSRSIGTSTPSRARAGSGR